MGIDIESLTNKSWCMTHILCRDDTVHAWHKVSSLFTVILSTGNNFGLLTLQFNCSCGGAEYKDYFFCLAEYDYILSECMKPLLTDNLVEIYMPNGDCGLFELHEKQQIKNFDGDVLNLLSAYNYDEKDESDMTVELLFETLSKRIVMRTMFKKLYYRCFRLAFRPEKNQARAASIQFATFVEECVQ